VDGAVEDLEPVLPTVVRDASACAGGVPESLDDARDPGQVLLDGVDGVRMLGASAVGQRARRPEAAEHRASRRVHDHMRHVECPVREPGLVEVAQPAEHGDDERHGLPRRQGAPTRDEGGCGAAGSEGLHDAEAPVRERRDVPQGDDVLGRDRLEAEDLGLPTAAVRRRDDLHRDVLRGAAGVACTRRSP
jgi:hypothetical protein